MINIWRNYKMQELYNLEIDENTFLTMIEMNPELKELTNKEILDKINLLEIINCNKRQIKNIISSNSLYLTRLNTEIKKLINYLVSIGFKNLNILFDANPYILNLDEFKVKNYIDKRIKSGEILSNIVDYLDSNPYLFLEM